MNRHVIDREPYTLLGWAAAHLGHTHIWPPESIPRGVVDEQGNIHAVVVYNAFYDGACFMHIASNHTRTWATRAVLSDLFDFAFNKIGARRVNLQVSSENLQIQMTALKLGFRFEGVQRGGWSDGADAVSFGMLAHECRYLEQFVPTPAQTPTQTVRSHVEMHTPQAEDVESPSLEFASSRASYEDDQDKAEPDNAELAEFAKIEAALSEQFDELDSPQLAQQAILDVPAPIEGEYQAGDEDLFTPPEH